MNAPQRIVWLDAGAYVVEHEHQAEYANIVTLRKQPASTDEIRDWQDSGAKAVDMPDPKRAFRGASR